MSPDKCLVKIGLLHEIGVELDDCLENLQRDSSMANGAKTAIVTASKAIEEFLINGITKDIASGDLTPANAVIARKYVSKCLEFLKGYETAAALTYTEKRGQEEAYTTFRNKVKYLYDQEQTKLNNFNAAATRLESEDNKRNRNVGQDVARRKKE